MQPSQGSTAPRNTRIWVTEQRSAGASAPRVELYDEDGAPVPVAVSEIAFGLPGAPPQVVTVLTPRELLAANRRYRYDVRASAGGAPAQRSFTTGDRIDDQPPAVPAIAFQDLGNGHEDTGGVAACVTEPWLVLSLDADTWIARRSPSATGEDAAQLDTERLSGSVGDFFPDGRDSGFEIAYGAPCAAPWDGQPLSMQLASFDLAGNFSGWSATERFVVPPLEPAAVWSGGCSVRDGSRGASPGLEAPWLVAFGIVVLALGCRHASRTRS